jgi:hypothetical protein
MFRSHTGRQGLYQISCLAACNFQSASVIGSGRVRFRPEEPKDALICAYGDLDVRLLIKAATGINTATLSENPAHCIIGWRLWIAGFNQAGMQMSEHRAIEKPLRQILLWSAAGREVLRNFESGFLLDGYERFIGAFEHDYVFAGSKVEAMPKINHRTDHRRFRIGSLASLPIRPLQSAERISLPEINARTKPIARCITP